MSLSEEECTYFSMDWFVRYEMIDNGKFCRAFPFELRTKFAPMWIDRFHLGPRIEVFFRKVIVKIVYQSSKPVVGPFLYII